MADFNVCAAAQAFFAGPHDCHPIGESSGFSGSTLARIEAAGAAWCLRRWPAGTKLATLQFIHEVLRHSHARGFRGVPRVAATATGETVVWRDGSYFDAQEWVGGVSLAAPFAGPGSVPNAVSRLTPLRLKALAVGLAGFHLSTSDLHPPLSARRPPLAQRLMAVGREVASHRARIELWITTNSDDELRELARSWLDLLPEAIAHAAAAPAANAPLPDTAGTIVHGDLWAPHVFFGGALFSGFVDFESLAWDAPVIDLAQVILHFNGWTDRATVLGAYADHRPLTALDEALLPVAAVLDLAGEGLWSLRTLATEPGWPPHRNRHIANLRALLTSLRALVDAHDPP